MQPTKSILSLAAALLLLGLTPTAAADDLHCHWILGTQYCVEDPGLGGLVVYPPENTHDPVCFDFRETHWCSETPGWPLSEISPVPLPPAGPVSPGALLDEPLPGGDDIPGPQDALNETGVPPVPGGDDIPDPQDALNETGVPPVPGGDDIPGPQDALNETGVPPLPGADDLPGPDDLPDPDGLPGLDDLPPVGPLPPLEDPLGLVPDSWDGPTFPIGRCLTGQYDMTGRIICIIETPFITIQETLEWLARL